MAGNGQHNGGERVTTDGNGGKRTESRHTAFLGGGGMLVFPAGENATTGRETGLAGHSGMGGREDSRYPRDGRKNARITRL